jgi:hypothetical protein
MKPLFKIILSMSMCVMSMSHISKAVASDLVYACDGSCGNMERVARVNSMIYNDGQPLSIIDLETGQVKTFIARKNLDQFGELIETVESTSTSSNASQVSSQYLNLRAQLGVTPIDIPISYQAISGFKDVYSSAQLVSDPQLADWIGTYLTQTVTLKNMLEAFIVDIANIGINKIVGKSLESTVLIRFDNGSTAKFKTTYVAENGVILAELKYVEGSARFSDGSRVPTSAANVIGNWYFESNADSDGFVRLGALWGIAFRFTGREEGCQPEVSESVCYSTPDGPVCEITYVCR